MITFELGLGVVPKELTRLLRLPTACDDFELVILFPETDFNLEVENDLLVVAPKLGFFEVTDFEICACPVETVKAIIAGKATPTMSTLRSKLSLQCDEELRCDI